MHPQTLSLSKGPRTSTVPFKVSVEALTRAMERCLRSCKRGSATCWEALCHTRRFKGPLRKTTQNCKGMAQTTSAIVSLFISRASWFRAALVPITAQAQLQNSNGTHILGTALLPLFLYHWADMQYMQLIWQIYRFRITWHRLYILLAIFQTLPFVWLSKPVSLHL